MNKQVTILQIVQALESSKSVKEAALKLEVDPSFIYKRLKDKQLHIIKETKIVVRNDE